MLSLFSVGRRLSHAVKPASEDVDKYDACKIVHIRSTERLSTVTAAGL